MKSCPTCNRTFEDTFTFCLVDGSILSAPFDPLATRQVSNARNTTPPPTEVMPPPHFSNSRDALPPTMLSPQPGYTPPTINNALPYSQPSQFSQGQDAVHRSQKKRPPVPWMIPIALTGLVLLILIYGGRDKGLSLWGLFIAIVLSISNLIAVRLNARNTTPPQFVQGQYIENIPQKKNATIPWVIPIGLVGLWLISLFTGFGGGLIHALLLVALILLVINLFTGGRRA